jgi:hypothetical protein
LEDLMPDKEMTQSVAIEATNEKKTWVKPAATVEEVAKVTENNSGSGADAITCHS